MMTLPISLMFLVMNKPYRVKLTFVNQHSAGCSTAALTSDSQGKLEARGRLARCTRAAVMHFLTARVFSLAARSTVRKLPLHVKNTFPISKLGNHLCIMGTKTICLG